MNKYTIFISELAYSDITNIVDYFVYITKDAEMGFSIADKIFSSIASLGELPRRYKAFYKEVYAVSVLSYFVFYIVDEIAKSVNVVRILHQRQDWERILRSPL